MLKKLIVVLAAVLTFVVLSTEVASAACSYFGCSPEQGNPIEELGGMIVFGVLLAGMMFGAARRYVK